MNIAYRKDIDGLRGVAVILVLLFHAFPRWVPGGFIGVDIFFVISGYLITGILLSDLATGRFSFPQFYLRRVRRLYPALLVVLIGTTLVGWLILLPDEFVELGRHIIASLTYSNNFLLWMESGYFDNESTYKPLLHFWSLAVEEQFYFLWPATLLLIMRLRTGHQKLILLFLTLAFLASSEALLKHSPSASYYLPISRFWELLAGACLAWYEIHGAKLHPMSISPERQLVRSGHVRSLVGFVLIGISLLLLDTETRFPGLAAVAPVLGACLIISAGPVAVVNRILLSSGWLVWFGLISYPLYLWHWPILSFLWIWSGELPNPAWKIAAMLTSVGLATLTFRLIEHPVRRTMNLNAISARLVGISCSVLVLGLVLKLGWISPMNAVPEAEKIVSASRDNAYLDGLVKDKRGAFSHYLNTTAHQARTILIGDSHAQQYSPRIVALAAEGAFKQRAVRIAAMPGCPPIPGIKEDRATPHCTTFVDDTLALAMSEAVDTVVIAACWNCYFIQQTSAVSPAALRDLTEFHYHMITEAGEQSFRTSNGGDIALHRLDATIRALTALNKRVYLLLDNPYDERINPKNYARGARLHGWTISRPPISVDSQHKEVELARSLTRLAEGAGAQVINPRSSLCPMESACLILDSRGEYIYADVNHLRASWVRDNADFLDAALQEPAAIVAERSATISR